MLEKLFEEAHKVAAEKNAEVIMYALYVLDVCQKGEGHKECRFLAELPSGNHACLKLTDQRRIIDKGVKEWQGQISPHQFDYDPPLGDNCPGRKKL